MSTGQLDSPATDFKRSVFGVLGGELGRFGRGVTPTATQFTKFGVTLPRVPAWDTFVADPRTEGGPTTESIIDDQVAAPSSAVKQAVRDRVLELIRCSIEDQEEIPATSSISGLNRFLEQFASTSMPLLATDTSGRIVATWRLGAQSMLSIKFVHGERIEFAWAFDAGSGKVVRNWGETSWGDFMPSFPHTRAFFGGAS